MEPKTFVEAWQYSMSWVQHFYGHVLPWLWFVIMPALLGLFTVAYRGLEGTWWWEDLRRRN